MRVEATVPQGLEQSPVARRYQVVVPLDIEAETKGDSSGKEMDTVREAGHECLLLVTGLGLLAGLRVALLQLTRSRVGTGAFHGGAA
jgi:hypothetical protein